MISTRRILLGTLLGALLIVGLTVSFAQAGSTSAPLPTPGAILRSVMPPMDLEPVNPHTRYSKEWWIAEADVQAWKDRYQTAVVVVIPAHASKPVYSPDGNGAATSILVMPQWRLTLYVGPISRGEALWCPLDEAVAILTGAAVATPVVDQSARKELAEIRTAVAQAIETLSSIK